MEKITAPNEEALMRRYEVIAPTPMPSLADTLAHSLRKVMAMDGRPNRRDYHPKEYDLYEQNVCEWEAAKAALALYDATNK